MYYCFKKQVNYEIVLQRWYEDEIEDHLLVSESLRKEVELLKRQGCIWH